MFPSKLLLELSNHKRQIEKQPHLLHFFCVAFDSADQQKHMPVLLKEYIINEICYSYQNLGYSLFSNLAIELAQNGIAELSGISSSFTKKYMNILKEFLSSEIEIFTDDSLDNSFAHEFVKRILCTEQEEDCKTGMSIFSENYINKIRNNEISLEGKMLDEYFNLKNKIQEDPLNLIVGRFESFIYSLRKEKSFFIYRDNSKEIYEKSRKLTALLTLLMPHQNKQGEFLFKNSMPTAAQLSKIISPKFNCAHFNLSSIQAWLGVKGEVDPTMVSELLSQAIDCGVVFKIPAGNHSFSYGLSENGMKILQPYQGVLTEILNS